MRKLCLTLVAAFLLCFAAKAQSNPTPAPGTCLVRWTPNAAKDNVVEYLLDYRPRESTNAWTTIRVPAGDTSTTGVTPSATVPLPGVEVEVRVAARNLTGQSPWSNVAFLPRAINGIQFVISIAP